MALDISQMTPNFGAFNFLPAGMSGVGGSGGTGSIPPAMMNTMMSGVSSAIGAQDFGAMFGGGAADPKQEQLQSMQQFTEAMGGIGGGGGGDDAEE